MPNRIAATASRSGRRPAAAAERRRVPRAAVACRCALTFGLLALGIGSALAGATSAPQRVAEPRRPGASGSPDLRQAAEWRADLAGWAIVWDAEQAVARSGTGRYPPERPAMETGAVHPAPGKAVPGGAEPGGTLAVAGAVSPELLAHHAPAHRIATAFLDGHAALLGLPTGTLALESIRPAGRLIHLRLRQMHAGWPVAGATLLLSHAAEGPLVAFSSRLQPQLRYAPSPSPPLSRAVAEATAAAALANQLPARGTGGPSPSPILWHSGRLVWSPDPTNPTAPAPLVWLLSGGRTAPPDSWEVAIDATTGAIQSIRSRVRGLGPAADAGTSGAARGTDASEGAPAPDVDRLAREAGPRRSGAAAGHRPGSLAPGDSLHGTVRALIRQPHPWGSVDSVALADLEVTLYDGPQPIATAFADTAGRFGFPADGLAEPSLRARLAGRHAVIHPHLRGAAPAQLEHLSPGVETQLIWDSLAATPAEREVYAHLQTASRWLARFAPALADSLDRPVPIVVNDSLLGCNALTYCDPRDPWIRFGAGSATCTNAGRIADVVYHEYGHLITLYAYAPLWAPDPLQEAYSDYFAATLRDTSRIAIGWQGPGSWLRDLDHSLRAPLSPFCESDPHCAGLLLGGALWQMRAALIRDLGRPEGVALADRLFHGMRAATPLDFQECLTQLLLQDDDDQDLTNGTPHLEAIAAGFERHGIGDFTVSLTHLPLGDTLATAGARPIEVGVASVYPPDPASLRVHLRVDEGPFVNLPLEGAGPLYRAILPAQEAGRSVQYYLTAADQAGHSARLPEQAPSVTFRYRIGEDATPPEIVHAPPERLTVEPGRLWLDAQVTDNQAPPESVWVDLEFPPGTVTRHPMQTLGPQHPDRYRAGLAVGPLTSSSEVRYRIGARDRATSANEATFPANGTITLPVSAGWAWDAEAPSSLVGGGAWTRALGEGDPQAPVAPSGERWWEVRPNAGMTQDAQHWLTTPLLDLSGWDRAQLVLKSWITTTDELTGARILARGDTTEPWVAVVPVDGYPAEIWFDVDQDGQLDARVGVLAGAEEGWRDLRVALDTYAGGAVQLGFVLQAFHATGEESWRVDDLALQAAPTLAPPLGLTAGEGGDGEVSLHWDPPPGLDPTRAGLIGYEVLRGNPSGDYDPQPVGPEPLTETHWTDQSVRNGTRYGYAVRAVYTEGTSSLSRGAVGFPYRAALELPPRLETLVPQADTLTDTVAVRNRGTGELALEFLVGDPDVPLAQLRPVLPVSVAPPGAFLPIAEDPPDAPAPDLRRLSSKLVYPNLLFRITLHGPLPDPWEDFTLRLYLDTDRSRATGFPGPNVGAEYIVALGAETAVATQGQALGYILDAELTYVGRPALLILQEGLDSLEVAVPLALLGSPDSLACAVTVRRGDEEGDQLPNAPQADWLSLALTHGRAQPDAPLPLVCRYDLSGQAAATLRATIHVLSNDPDQPVATLPVIVQSGGPVGITRLALGHPAPNPFADQTRLLLRVPAGTPWEVDILDVGGRLVRRLAKGTSSGMALIPLQWDGRRSSGEQVASGVYFAWARGGGVGVSRRVLVVR